MEQILSLSPIDELEFTLGGSSFATIRLRNVTTQAVLYKVMTSPGEDYVPRLVRCQAEPGGAQTAGGGERICDVKVS